jgi:hypothetical protein
MKLWLGLLWQIKRTRADSHGYSETIKRRSQA